MIRSCKKRLAGVSLIIITSLSLLFAAKTHANVQNVTEHELYAAYLTTVLDFVRWPNEAEKENLQVGIVDSSEVMLQLSTVNIENVRNMPIVVRDVVRTSQINQLDVVVVGERAQGTLSQVESLARNNNILVITLNGNIRSSTMINLSSNENTELTFQVNSQRIEQAGLITSDGIFEISGDELELVVALWRQQSQGRSLSAQINDYESQLAQTTAQNRQLRERITMLEEALTERDNALRAQAGTIEDREQAIADQRATLNRLLLELDDQRNRILMREEQLAMIQQQLQASQDLLAAQQQELDMKEALLNERQQESDVLSERITSNRNVLAAQQQQLRDQREEIEAQLQLIESREATISRQQDYLLYIGIGLLIALFFAVLSIVLYANKRKTANELMHALHELNDAQDKLVESEKMAALGNLVAGVAHEVNTPLGVALTATSMLNDRRERLIETIEAGQLTKEQLDSFLGKANESLTLTEKNLARVARLISNFKQVAVDQMVSERREIDLREYLEEIMSTLSIELRRASVDYRILVEHKITMVTIPGAMAQIITNLTTNSIRHAFEGRSGTITLSAEKVAGDQIKLVYADNGNGMNAEVLEKVFEPFFTTKRNEGGTGLGMPIVYNLVRQKLHGDIKVESELTQGTRFVIIMPRVSPI
ncbi:MAG: two component signal transduction system histidine kinase with DUF4154 domain [Idiomarinaceae bacterium HL-53]|nr:MAG: two component signal transduction system histidine kinase with DUF4154 domain [Idiomarinaceae bacterium HL-53]CUS48586.1 His Kinase A (phospho-acceptor) domain-containing protein [Idiomarinaceae bacterium HL-53]